MVNLLYNWSLVGSFLITLLFLSAALLRAVLHSPFRSVEDIGSDAMLPNDLFKTVTGSDIVPRVIYQCCWKTTLPNGQRPAEFFRLALVVLEVIVAWLGPIGSCVTP
jgi:hypothetical protein